LDGAGVGRVITRSNISIIAAVSIPQLYTCS
jgi:hypothetical protein